VTRDPPVKLDGHGNIRFVTSQGSAYHRFRRALDRGNVTEALSAGSELQHIGLAEALELCLLLRDKAPERYPRAALRWHGRLCREVDVSFEEAQAILAALVVHGRRAERERGVRSRGPAQPARARTSLRDTCRLGPRGVELLERGQSREGAISGCRGQAKEHR
jgi:hypothetical protein